MHIGFDVSKWQTPSKWDWPALKQKSDTLRRLGHPGLLFLARATYGSEGSFCVDPTFREYAKLARAGGLVFGAYHFYRQTHPVDDQLALFEGELRGIGGLSAGDLLPVLDLEHNGTNGDGEPDGRFRVGARQMAESLAVRYGGCILYYSSYFPEHLGAPKDDSWKWMHGEQYRHWLADYSVADGNPRTPYLAPGRASVHQPKPRRTGYYASGEVDHAFSVNGAQLSDLLIQRPASIRPPVPKPGGRAAALLRASEAARALADALAEAAAEES